MKANSSSMSLKGNVSANRIAVSSMIETEPERMAIVQTPQKREQPNAALYQPPPSAIKRQTSLQGLSGDDLAFETFYQRLKQQTSDRVLEMLYNSDSNVLLDADEVMMGDDDDATEDAHVLRCLKANRANRVLQFAANKALAEEVLFSCLSSSFFFTN
jgi:hypothetical protein